MDLKGEISKGASEINIIAMKQIVEEIRCGRFQLEQCGVDYSHANQAGRAISVYNQVTLSVWAQNIGQRAGQGNVNLES